MIQVYSDPTLYLKHMSHILLDVPLFTSVFICALYTFAISLIIGVLLVKSKSNPVVIHALPNQINDFYYYIFCQLMVSFI